MKKKKNNGNRKLLDTVKNLTKKTGQVEKEKREKKKRLKSNKPRGYVARRAGSIAFWVITSFVLLFIIVNIGGKSSGDEEVTIVESEATSYSAIEYSRSFLNDLFNIPEDSDERTKREEKLEKYTINNKEIASSFDSENVVKVDRKNIILKSVTKPEDDERARHTFSLDLVIEENFSEEESDEYDSLEKEERLDFISKMMEEDEGIVSVENKKKIREQRLYVVVAIEHNETGFVIYENPSFTFVHDEDKGINNMYSELTALSDSEVTDNLENFLNTFFKSFADDDKDSLAYLLDDEEYSYGLGNTLDFEQVNEAQFYEGKGKDYIAKASVTFINNETNLKMNSDYMLVIKKSGDKHIVTHINDDEYIYEVLHGEKEEEDNESDEESNNENESTEEIDDDEAEATFNQLKQAVQGSDLEGLHSMLSKGTLDELDEKIRYNFGDLDEPLSDDEMEELLNKTKKKASKSDDEKYNEAYEKMEKPEDMGVAFSLSQLAMIFEDDSADMANFENYDVDASDNGFIVSFHNENDEDGQDDSDSKTEISITFDIDENNEYKLDDYNIQIEGSISDNEAEFFPVDNGEEKSEKKSKKKDKDKKSKDSK